MAAAAAEWACEIFVRSTEHMIPEYKLFWMPTENVGSYIVYTAAYGSCCITYDFQNQHIHIRILLSDETWIQNYSITIACVVN